jgi:hypothetical protein
MMIVKWTIGTGFVEANHSGEWEVDDDTNDDELDDMLLDELNDHIEYWWERPPKDAGT